MHRPTREALVAHLAAYDPIVEVGIGHRVDVAAHLADRGVDVTATDIHERSVPDAVEFVRDDVTDPTLSVYADAAAIYALNCPPELHRPVLDIARAVDAVFCFTTLGGDPPSVPVERHTLPVETLFVAKTE